MSGPSDEQKKSATLGRARRAKGESCSRFRVEEVLIGKQGPEVCHRRALIMARTFSGWSGKIFRNATRLSQVFSLKPREIGVRTIHRYVP